ncbi:MAG: aminopeptidase [Clostridia bacterium]|nr:aminopeptidase [Clostridia bacterium]
MTQKELYKSLTYERKNVYEKLTDEQKQEMLAFCEEYKTFLNSGKTERECIVMAEKMAAENGFVNMDAKKQLKPGDRVYKINRGKNILLAVIGSEDIEDGVNVIGAHVDSPRLDLKQNPLYESCDLALLKTHYYGGIKKYQWPATPLAMHGVIHTSSGEKINICIGEDENDPVFCVTDLLPHLAKDQMTKKMTEGIEGESLNILVGGMGIYDDDVSEKVKFYILKLLNERYGIVEKDFISAEIELVPAFRARDVGLDASFVGAYGQDDRVCAFTALKSIITTASPKKTAVCVLVDKEEIGSVGNTGMLSRFFDMTLAEIVHKIKGSCDLITYNRVISNTACMSSDVGVAVDPNYEGVTEKRNSAYAGKGLIVMKYTGARGKSESSDANAEFVYQVCKILDDNNIVWQTGELGKVDQGGGGTIAQYVANMNIDVIDCGVPVLSMHSPFEITAKGDIYMAYLAYNAFFKCR